jgi:hypothetical protein
MRGRIVALTFLISLSFADGCMTPQKNNNGNSDLMPSAGFGSGSSMPATVTSEDEEWSKLGRQMRGDQPAQQSQSFDPLRDIMVSPRAQSIERSLGVDN